MTETTKQTRSICGGHHGVITKIIREVDDILATDAPLTVEQSSQLNVKMQQLEAKLKVLSDIDKDILSKCDVSEIEHEIVESKTITAKIMNYQQRIHEAITAPTGPSATVVPTPTAVSTTVPIRPRLPKLTLPRLTTWTTFWDSFNSTVHENARMSKVNKFSYLKSLVEGPASGCIQGLTLSEANYDANIAMLQERFGRPQQIITAHMEELLKIQGSVGDRPSSLRFTLDKIVHVHGLESLGIRWSQYGSLFIPVIMSKFPNEIRLRAACEANNDVWEIDKLLEVIKKEVKARETSEGIHVNPNKVVSYNSRSQGTSNPTTSSFVTNSNTIRCVYCNGNHFSASCIKVMDINTRRDILKKTGRCFNCLKSHHKSRQSQKLSTFSSKSSPINL